MSISSLSNTLSMFIWGLVMVKAKTGFTASGKQESAHVQSSFGKMIGLAVLIGVATVAKLNADHHFIENMLEPNQ